MKVERLKNWEDKKELDCLLFFALRLRELVFDYTLDTFKYPALNSTASCKEALKLISEIESNNITSRSLEPVIAELQWKIRKDNVVKHLVGDDITYYLNFGDLNNLKDIRLKLELLYNKIEPSKYCRTSEYLLSKYVSENKEKNKINSICSNYVSSLINSGFSQSYIYLATNIHFFSDNKVEEINHLTSFFELFDRKPESYKVITKCSGLLKEISQSSYAFNSQIEEELPPEILALDKSNYLESKRNNEAYFVSNNVVALDPVTAKLDAERRINKLSKLFVFYHHKKHPDWHSKSLVINDNSNNVFLLDERTSPMSKGRDLKPKKAAVKLNNLIKGLSLHSSSFAKYDRAIDLHGLSIENKYIENQLLQNWIAFETLLVGYSSKSKIEQVLDHLMPFLKYNYLARTIDEFSRDLMRFDRRFFTSEFKKIEIGDSLHEKIAALISLDDYKLNRVNIYKHLEKSPLLKWRLSKFHDFFGKPEAIKDFFDTHELKVKWQIKRMYQTRNLIVHAGIIPDYTETLVENSHSYLDLLLGTINELSINGNQIHSIEQAIEEVSIRVKKHEKYLKNKKDKALDKSNFKNLIFGI